MFTFCDVLHDAKQKRKQTLASAQPVKVKMRRLNTFSITTVFVDTRLWKTKHSWKRFQNLGSRLGWKVTLVAVSGGFRSDLSLTRKTDGNFGNVSASVLFSKVAYQRKRW